MFAPTTTESASAVITLKPANEFGTNRRDTRRSSATMRISVLAFAALRELLAASEWKFELTEGARVADAWDALVAAFPAVREERASTRVARNGQIVSFEETLSDGDELALLPPVGGG